MVYHRLHVGGGGEGTAREDTFLFSFPQILPGDCKKLFLDTGEKGRLEALKNASPVSLIFLGLEINTSLSQQSNASVYT